MVANNIAKTSDGGRYKMFRAVCGCSAQNHDQQIFVEHDEDQCINVTIYSNLKYYDWKTSDSNFIVKSFSRIKAAWNILTKGYLEFEGEFSFFDSQSAKDYANALLDSVNKFEKKEE